MQDKALEKGTKKIKQINKNKKFYDKGSCQIALLKENKPCWRPFNKTKYDTIERYNIITLTNFPSKSKAKWMRNIYKGLVNSFYFFKKIQIV